MNKGEFDHAGSFFFMKLVITKRSSFASIILLQSFILFKYFFLFDRLSNHKIYLMEEAFKEMVFEWEYLHPKGSVTNEQELSPTQLIPVADKEPEDEPREEAIFSEEKLVMDEVVAVEEEEIASQEMEEETDWALQSLLFEDEEEDASEMVEFKDQKIKEKFDFEAFRLKKWLRSAVMAAATISIFIFGGVVQLSGERKNTQSSVFKKEKVKAALPSISLIGHYDERF